jgi:ubiquinone/menaquinone biosynthesis C-methylase UbiE
MKKISDIFEQKTAVKEGYDTIADLYQEYILKSRLREQSDYLNYCLNTFATGSIILDVGCGSGIPTTQQLAKNFEVTGVDISETQIKLAKINVPNAKFIQADIATIELKSNYYDAITAFYSLFHVPRSEIQVLLSKLYLSLKTNGQLVATFLAEEDETLENMNAEMRNAPMFRSSFSPDENLEILMKIGFKIIKSDLSKDLEVDGGEDTMFWVIAEK